MFPEAVPAVFSLAAAFFIGLAAGALSSIAGVGGGIVVVPLLRVLLKVPIQQAIAVSVVLVLVTSVSGALGYLRRGLVHRDAVFFIGFSGCVFSVAGTLLSQGFSGRFLVFFLAAFMFFVSALLFFAVSVHNSPSPLRGRFSGAWLWVGVGSLAGFVGGFVGVGGGIFIVSMLVLSNRFPMHSAVATSLASMAVYSLPSAFIHASIAGLNFPLLLACAAGSIVSSRLGVKKALHLGERTLRLSVAAVVFVLAVVLVVNELFLA